MIKCSNGCTPCCDFCIHAYHEYFEDPVEGYLNGFIRGGPIGCIIHYDEKHQEIAKHCGHCDDEFCGSDPLLHIRKRGRMSYEQCA